MIPALKKKTNRLLYEEQNDFVEEIISLFTGQCQGHMECWEYGPAAYEGDPAGGAEHWSCLVQEPGFYYPTKSDIRAVQWATNKEELLQKLSPIKTVVELGPGNKTSIEQKTIPFLKACADLEKYIVIDAAVEQAKEAGKLIERQLSLPHRAIEQNYIGSPLSKSWRERSAIIMWGSSLGNIEGHANEKPFPKLVQRLANFRKALTNGDLFIFTFDTETNKQAVINAYSEPALHASILSPLFHLKRDGLITGNFDPRIWRHEPVWFEKSGQCAHTIFPLFDQSFSISGINIKIPAWRRFISNNSYKFSPETVERAASKANIKPLMCFSDGPIAMFVGQAV